MIRVNLPHVLEPKFIRPDPGQPPRHEDYDPENVEEEHLQFADVAAMVDQALPRKPERRECVKDIGETHDFCRNAKAFLEEPEPTSEKNAKEQPGQLSTSCVWV